MILGPHVLLAMAAMMPATEQAPPKALPLARPFDLSAVRLLDGPFREAMRRDAGYLLLLDPDRLLANFRHNAGLPTSAQPYGGWEGPTVEVRGHAVGHYLSACAQMYASTGEPRFKERADAIVAGFAQCQAALTQRGGNPGYLSAFPEEFFDRLEAGKGVWAPYYTLHKLFAGLIEAYEHCGNQQALDTAVKFAGWVKLRMDKLTEEQRQRALNNEHGGMLEALANLYGLTGKPEILATARYFDHKVIFDPLERGEDRLTGLHANTQIPKWIGSARMYELTGEPRWEKVAKTAWSNVALHRSYVTGGHSDGEMFQPPERFSKQLSPGSTETCNTYNMLKLSWHLFGWHPAARIMDFYERALYNHILASQDPATGMTTYYMALDGGRFKTFCTPENSFWCCTGTGMENHAKYGETIWFHSDDALWLNLFVASELTWAEKGLTIRQETAFPVEQGTKLTIHAKQPTKLTLWLRRPFWAGAGFAVTVNGKPFKVSDDAGSYIKVEATWRDGDQVALKLPFAMRTEAMPDDPSVEAVCYGPLVLAGDLGHEGIKPPAPYAQDQWQFAVWPKPKVPPLVGDAKTVAQRLKPVAGAPNTFTIATGAEPAEVTLKPYYLCNDDRYTVYWHALTPDEYAKRRTAEAIEEQRLAALAKRTVDSVRIGDPVDEKAHGLVGEKTGDGEAYGGHWRHATDGGWFGYTLKAGTDEPLALVCTFFGGDVGQRQFDIVVEGQVVGTMSLVNQKPGEWLHEEYAIPPELTKGKATVAVKLQAKPGNFAGGLFGLVLARK